MRILFLLRNAEVTVQSLADELEMTPLRRFPPSAAVSSLSQLVRSRKEGRNVFYSSIHYMMTACGTCWRQACPILLVVLFMSTMLVIPSRMDLELCFGKDGHVDLSLGSCPDGASPKIPARERSSIYGTAHYDDFLHMAVVCGTAQELIRNGGNSDSYKSELKKDPSKTPLLFSESLAGSAGAYLDSNVHSIPFEDFPSLHLVSLRTIVLLI